MKRLISTLICLILLTGVFHYTIEAHANEGSNQAVSMKVANPPQSLAGSDANMHGCHLGCCPAMPTGRSEARVVFGESRLDIVKDSREIVTSSFFLFRPPKA